jgi:hypothetical protein
MTHTYPIKRHTQANRDKLKCDVKTEAVKDDQEIW